MNERRFLAKLIASLPTRPEVMVAAGDDAAVYRWPATGDAVVTTDMLMEGVHFERALTPARAIGYKALAVNLSDIAAMAAIPRLAVVSLALPHSMPAAEVEALMGGLSDLARSFGVAVVGGDTNSWQGPLVINVALTGEATGRGVVQRSGAKAGDLIMVTGRLGGSLASGRHLSFIPRVGAALALHERADLHAMMDLSDGLASDLRRLCLASGLGAEIDGPALPLHEELQGLPDAWQRACSDGEDFELLFTLAPAAAAKLLADPPELGCALTCIGRMTAGDKIMLRDAAGKLELMPWHGYEHQVGE